MEMSPNAYINAVTGDGNFKVKAITNLPGKKKITFVNKRGETRTKTFTYGIQTN